MTTARTIRPPEPITQPGDIWELDDHLVICADALSLDLVAVNAGNPVDLILTDPPYAIFGSSTGVASDVADDRMVRPFFQAIARRAALSLPPYGHAYVHCDWRSWAALWEGFRLGGLAMRNMIVWDKGSPGHGHNYMGAHELIAFAQNVPRHTAGSDSHGAHRPVYSSNILRVPRPRGADRLHNAAKPLALLEPLIASSTDRGDTVGDLFAGSGSVLLAAHNLGRRAVVVDIDPSGATSLSTAGSSTRAAPPAAIEEPPPTTSSTPPPDIATTKGQDDHEPPA